MSIEEIFNDLINRQPPTDGKCPQRDADDWEATGLPGANGAGGIWDYECQCCGHMEPHNPHPTDEPITPAMKQELHIYARKLLRSEQIQRAPSDKVTFVAELLASHTFEGGSRKADTVAFHNRYAIALYEHQLIEQP